MRERDELVVATVPAEALKEIHWDRRRESFAASARAASAKKFLDLCVVSQEKDEEIFGSVFKQETQGQIAPTLEKTVAELADANPTVAMGLTESVRQLNEGQQTFDAVPFLKLFSRFRTPGSRERSFFKQSSQLVRCDRQELP